LAKLLTRKKKKKGWPQVITTGIQRKGKLEWKEKKVEPSFIKLYFHGGHKKKKKKKKEESGAVLV